jgi:disulfide bond formation protein DsbB
MRFTRLQQAGLVAAALAGAGLLTALAAENWGGLVPCALCLVERWPYRATILLGALTVASQRAARPLLALAALAMLASVVLGGVHVGVEAGLWPSPLPECAAPQLGGGTVAERLQRMPARPAKPCDEPTYLVPGLPLSMAAMNLIFSLALTIGMTMVAWPKRTIA